jgi:DNA-binding YbaB/EbfC family protein
MNLMKMMQQAQQIQGRMQQMQEELAGIEIEGQSGAGLVKVTLNGKVEARAVKIDPSLIKPEEAETGGPAAGRLQDAKGKVEAAVQAKMGRADRGPQPPRPQAVLGLPPPRSRGEGTGAARPANGGTEIGAAGPRRRRGCRPGQPPLRAQGAGAA